MGAYKVHWATARSPVTACQRRKASVITTVRPGDVTCMLCALAIAIVPLVVAAKRMKGRT